MNRLKRSLPLILIALALLLSGVKSVHSQQSRNQSDTTKADKEANRAGDEQAISQAFAAAILETLRAEVHQEVAKREQDHSDHEDWNTKPFWLMFGLNAALVLVGGAYTCVAYRQLGIIDRQTNILSTAMRAQRLASLSRDYRTRSVSGCLWA